MPNVRIGKVKVGDTPRLVATVTTPQNPAAAAKARTSGADIVELRLDYLAALPEEKVVEAVRKAASAAAIPVIATLRTPREGGIRRDGFLSDEKKREAMFRAVIPHVHAVDVELSSPILSEVIGAAHKEGKTAIVSYHHFHSTPSISRLRALAQLARAKGGDIAKIVTTTKTPVEMIRLFSLLHERPAWPMSAFSIGPHSLLSRLLACFFQSSLLYAGLPGNSLPGQPDILELRTALKQFGLR